ncbi:MAG: glycosyltransferase [Nitrospira sp.]|nr:glycosyltransferase [Nitrospira sp.]MDH4242191.1 glycosyltransferase [Nitrospira sp.]MDH4357031.1 glycosyltransferase [Nitrospira sp.]MDH5317587.1 glycosyltransferase [Nitrospira sp.]
MQVLRSMPARHASPNRVGSVGRVALYLPSLVGGGAERVMMLLANGFAERGYMVDLVLAKAEGPYLKQVDTFARIVDLKSRHVILSLPGLVSYLRRERPTALLSALNHANVIACLARRLARVPTRLVISEHTTLSVSRPQNARGHLVPWVMRWMYPWADAVVAISQGVADDLARTIGISAEWVKVIYNPVVNDELLAKAQEPIDHSWFRNDAPPVVLGVGRLTEAKDFPILIRAFARVRAQRQARLMILGEGGLRPQLEALVRQLGLKDDVALPGFVANAFAYMAHAAVFVFSSRWEGFGNVLVEAMACGTPVVSTDCPSGPREILEDGRWGRLVPVGDVDGLAGAMAATLEETEYPDVAARAGEFNVDRAMDGYLNLMLQAAAPEEAWTRGNGA